MSNNQLPPHLPQDTRSAHVHLGPLDVALSVPSREMSRKGCQMVDEGERTLDDVDNDGDDMETVAETVRKNWK